MGRRFARQLEACDVCEMRDVGRMPNMRSLEFVEPSIIVAACCVAIKMKFETGEEHANVLLRCLALNGESKVNDERTESVGWRTSERQSAINKKRIQAATGTQLNIISSNQSSNLQCRRRFSTPTASPPAPAALRLEASSRGVFETKNL